jgi:ribokinase
MICVVGSVLVDLMAYSEKLPMPGETVTGFNYQITAGGKGANQAAAAACLGVQTYFLGKISGRDKLAQVLWDGFSRAGVDTSEVGIEDTMDCGVGVIHVGEKSQNQIIIVLGPNLHLDKEYIDSKSDIIASSKVVLTEFGIPLPSAEYATSVAKKAGAITLVNPAPALPMSESFLRSADVLTPNETEAEILTGIKVVNAETAKKAAAIFHQKQVNNVIITMGDMGVFVSDGSRCEFIESIDCQPVDTTGAGDAFSGGLAVALTEGNEIFAAARYANVVAGLSVTRSGTMKSMPNKAEVDAYIQNHGLY